MRCGVPSSKIIQNFKMTTAEHLTKHGALWDCTGHTPTELAWILYLLKILIFYSSWVFFYALILIFKTIAWKYYLSWLLCFPVFPLIAPPREVPHFPYLPQAFSACVSSVLTPGGLFQEVFPAPIPAWTQALLGSGAFCLLSSVTLPEHPVWTPFV